MKTKNRRFNQAVLLACLGLAIPALGAGEAEMDSRDQILSPYFFVPGGDPGLDALPLKSTRAQAAISGVIADVQVTQVYKNEGQKTLEAVYIFPASTRAAVYAMKMTIGERTIVADIQERQKAREQYEQALSEGKTASLLEQQRPNVFQMNVGNILPGDEIRVVLNYTETLVPSGGVYEFVYPAVVGPRYSNQPAANAPATEKWVANPYLHSGEEAPFTFGFELALHSGIPIAQITSPSHDLNVEFTGQQTAQVGLKDRKSAGNRDVVIRYSLAGARIESGLLLEQGEKENFFLLMLEPPKRVETQVIVPREYVFVVDVSGSMYGFPLNVSKALLKDLLDGLRPSDSFNVMLFSGGNSVLSERSLPATPANLQKALDLIDRQQGGGGTELMPALRAALALPKAEANLSRSLIIVTDGYVSVEKDAFEYIRTHLNQGNVFPFGIGSSVNRYLIEGLAHAGMGEPFIVLNETQAKTTARAFREYIQSPVLTGIHVEFSGIKVADVEPAAMADLFAAKPVLLFGKYTGAARGRVIVTGKTAGTDYRQEIEISDRQASKDNKALRYLWARHRILTLADMNKLDPSDARVKTVTQLGLDYSLLTDYTSFVAVDSKKRADGQGRTTVQQPLPLPQGVSDYAVGGGVQPSACAPALSCQKSRRACASETYWAAPAADAEPADREKLEKPADRKPKAPEQAGIEYEIRVLSGSILQADAEQALAAVQNGWNQELKSCARPGLLSVRLQVNAQGKVVKMEMVEDTLRLPKLLARMKRELGQIMFAKTRAGAMILLTVKVEPHRQARGTNSCHAFSSLAGGCRRRPQNALHNLSRRGDIPLS